MLWTCCLLKYPPLTPLTPFTLAALSRTSLIPVSPPPSGSIAPRRNETPAMGPGHLPLFADLDSLKAYPHLLHDLIHKSHMVAKVCLAKDGVEGGRGGRQVMPAEVLLTG